MTKASAFTTETTIADADKIPFIKDPDGTPLNRIITKGNFGGGKTFAALVKPADETITNDSTLSDDDTLFFSANANKTYGIYMQVFGRSVGAADLKYAISIPSGATAKKGQAAWQSDNFAPTIDFTTAEFLITLGDDRVFSIRARVIVGGTAGTIAFQWAQNTSDAGNTTIHEGSYLIAWEE